MKRFALLFPFILLLLAVTTNISLAQATDPASKTTEIMTLINSKVKLSAQQQTDVQKVVSELSTKYASSNKKASSGSGLEAKLGADEQKALNSKANTDIPKLLDSNQKTQYTAIQDKVTSLFSQIK